ncbi:MAG TPA: sigma-70 family RNA polymerase sigma factor [Candidatus Hodarchaeales archaeon]|nr:MAG: hypothetical protein A3F68_06600 [Acidobacteria bacterium RIFCSPLOWO2_12_FULL_54_10]HKZ41253.1 sigma-70 family RNA polymerase sigma factor [Candidatus Hodarchaeales archaeon]
MDRIDGAVFKLEELPDNELVLKAQQGDKKSFAVLAIRHSQKVYRMAWGVLRNEADAEEIAQESFMKALEKISSFRGEAQFSTWLIQITLNEARMRLRKYRPRLHESIDEVSDDTDEFRPKDLRDWRLNPEERLSQRELQILLEKSMGKLSRKYREILLLRDVELLSNGEAARVLGISLAAAKSRSSRARLMMREFLTPYLKVPWHERIFRKYAEKGRSL